jgi:hypothetical protein
VPAFKARIRAGFPARSACAKVLKLGSIAPFVAEEGTGHGQEPADRRETEGELERLGTEDDFVDGIGMGHKRAKVLSGLVEEACHFGDGAFSLAAAGLLALTGVCVVSEDLG